MQLDLGKAREIRTRFLINPVTVAIFVVIMLLYAWLDVGQVVPTQTDMTRILATLYGSILYFTGFYLFLPMVLSSRLTGPLPFFWKIVLLMNTVLILESISIFLITSKLAGVTSVAEYYIASLFTNTAGVLAFCAIFRGNLERLFGEDPLTTIFGRRRTHNANALQALLPQDVRGDILQLEAQSPYLEVTKRNGAALVRMSMKAAMEHVDQDAGWLVHRSRWVHKSRVVDLKRQGRNRYFVDPDGREYPISREMEATLEAYLQYQA